MHFYIIATYTMFRVGYVLCDYLFRAVREKTNTPTPMEERPEISPEEWASMSPAVKKSIQYLLNVVDNLVTTRASEMNTLGQTIDT